MSQTLYKNGHAYLGKINVDHVEHSSPFLKHFYTFSSIKKTRSARKEANLESMWPIPGECGTFIKFSRFAHRKVLKRKFS